MTKADIVNQTAGDVAQPPFQINVIVDAFLANLKQAAKKGEPVFIRGFGTFAIVTRAQKTARNIKAGTPMLIAANNVVKFKPSKEYKAKQ